MKVRYRAHPSETTSASRFNLSALSEVLTGDDSAFINELDVWLEQKQCWKPMAEAFRDHELITDNHNTIFFEPRNVEERECGFAL